MVGIFLLYLLCFVLPFVLLVSAFVTLISIAVLFIYEGYYKEKPAHEISKRAIPLAILIFLVTNFICCIFVYIEYAPLYFP